MVAYGLLMVNTPVLFPAIVKIPAVMMMMLMVAVVEPLNACETLIITLGV